MLTQGVFPPSLRVAELWNCGAILFVVLSETSLMSGGQVEQAFGGGTELVRALADDGAKTPPKSKTTTVKLSAKAVPEQPDAALIRDSAESAIRLSQVSAEVSRESSGCHASRQGRGSCLTCHQSFLPQAAMGQAKDRGVRLDRDVVTKLGDQVAAG